MNAANADMPAGVPPIEVLGEDACWEFLASQRVGRLAMSVAGAPDIFPVNYAVAGRTLMLHTAPGTKVAELTANSSVAFEVDWWDRREATSVVLRGEATPLDDEAEIAEANELRLQSWAPTLKSIFVRISPAEVSGRRIRLTGDVQEGRTGRTRDIADLAWIVADNWRPPTPGPSRRVED